MSYKYCKTNRSLSERIQFRRGLERFDTDCVARGRSRKSRDSRYHTHKVPKWNVTYSLRVRLPGTTKTQVSVMCDVQVAVIFPFPAVWKYTYNPWLSFCKCSGPFNCVRNLLFFLRGLEDQTIVLTMSLLQEHGTQWATCSSGSPRRPSRTLQDQVALCYEHFADVLAGENKR